MSDYGYDFSFYLLSQLSEETDVFSVTWYHHSRLVVLAMAHKFWISILCRESLPHSSLEAPRVAHICSQISAFLLCDCVIILQGQAVWWEPPHLLIPLGPRHWVQHPPSAGNSLLEQHQHLWRARKTCLSRSPRGVQMAKNFCKMEGNELSMVALL